MRGVKDQEEYESRARRVNAVPYDVGKCMPPEIADWITAKSKQADVPPSWLITLFLPATLHFMNKPRVRCQRDPQSTFVERASLWSSVAAVVSTNKSGVLKIIATGVNKVKEMIQADLDAEAAAAAAAAADSGEAELPDDHGATPSRNTPHPKSHSPSQVAVQNTGVFAGATMAGIRDVLKNGTTNGNILGILDEFRAFLDCNSSEPDAQSEKLSLYNGGVSDLKCVGLRLLTRCVGVQEFIQTRSGNCTRVDAVSVNIAGCTQLDGFFEMVDMNTDRNGTKGDRGMSARILFAAEKPRFTLPGDVKPFPRLWHESIILATVHFLYSCCDQPLFVLSQEGEQAIGEGSSSDSGSDSDSDEGEPGAAAKQLGAAASNLSAMQTYEELMTFCQLRCDGNQYSKRASVEVAG